jgi:hypothetical protein
MLARCRIRAPPRDTSIVAALPLPIVASELTASGPLVLSSCVIFFVAALVAGPIAWPGEGRTGSLVICVGAALTTLIAGCFTLLALFAGGLCSEGDRDYLSPFGAVLAIAGFLVPYAAGSAWAVDDDERALWAWPAAIVLALTIGIVVLALVEGGPHHCET